MSLPFFCNLIRSHLLSQWLIPCTDCSVSYLTVTSSAVKDMVRFNAHGRKRISCFLFFIIWHIITTKVWIVVWNLFSPVFAAQLHKSCLNTVDSFPMLCNVTPGIKEGERRCLNLTSQTDVCSEGVERAHQVSNGFGLSSPAYGASCQTKPIYGLLIPED